MTIKMRILIPMMLFTAVAAAAILISNIVLFSRYVNADGASRLDSSSLVAQNEIYRLKMQAGAVSLYFAGENRLENAIARGDSAELTRLMQQLLEENEIDFCAVTDEGGVILAGAGTQAIGADSSVMSGVRSAISGKAVTTIEAGVSVNMSLCAFAPIYNPPGELIGTIGVGFRFDTNDFVDNIKAITGCEVTVLNGDMRISTTILQEDGSRVIGTRASPDISSVVLSGKPYDGYTRILTHDMITKYIPLSDFDGDTVGMLSVGHYMTEELSTIRAFVGAGVIVTLVLLLLFIAIILVITERLVTPINEAAGVLAEIAKGNFGARVTGSYTGELAVIKNTVNQTAQDLSQYMHAMIEAEYAAQELQRARAGAEELSLIKSRFLANMSHEIRTPMNAVIGMADLLLIEDLSTRQKRYAETIKSSGINLLGIINSILDLSKIEAGKFDIVPVHFDFKAFLRSIDSIFEYSAQSKNIEYIAELAGDIPDVLYCDDIRLRQVLTNLLGNAVKFTSEGYVRLKTCATSDTLFFEISDSGPGIKPEDLEKLFNPFEQVDTRVNRSKTGTGLGLSISKGIVESMRGSLTAQSVYGDGSIFSVSIPRVDGDPNKITDAEVTIEFSAPTANILVVDDFDVNLSVVTGLLRLCDIDCDTAMSGETAIEMAQKKKYDIIFMDHMMPEMDGVETTRRLRGMGFEKSEYPIIALTANAVEGVRETLLACGMNDFLSKPISRPLLSNMLIKWLPAEKVTETVPGDRQDDTQDEPDIELRALRAARELDIDSALKLTGGSKEIYKDALRIFTNRLPALLDEMSEFLDADDLARFAIDIHGVKNSLATAGARDMAAEAYELELRAKAGDKSFCVLAYQPFSEQLEVLRLKLEAVLSPEPHTPSVPGNFNVLIIQLEELARCLNDFDDDSALEITNSLLGYDYGAEINAQLMALRRELEAFSYDAAARLLGSIKSII